MLTAWAIEPELAESAGYRATGHLASLLSVGIWSQQDASSWVGLHPCLHLWQCNHAVQGIAELCLVVCPLCTQADCARCLICKDLMKTKCCCTVSAGLYGRLVPQTVANFLATVRAGSFSGTVFNRVTLHNCWLCDL